MQWCNCRMVEWYDGARVYKNKVILESDRLIILESDSLKYAKTFEIYVSENPRCGLTAVSSRPNFISKFWTKSRGRFAASGQDRTKRNGIERIEICYKSQCPNGIRQKKRDPTTRGTCHWYLSLIPVPVSGTCHLYLYLLLVPVSVT